MKQLDASTNVGVTPAAEQGITGDEYELSAVELVDPAVPSGDPVMPRDGPELPVAEQEAQVSKPAVTSPPDNTAACTA